MRQRIEFALEPGNDPPAHVPWMSEDDEERAAHRDLLVKIVYEPQDTLEGAVEEKRLEAVDDQGSGSMLIQERRRGDPQVLEAPWIGRAHPAVERRHVEGLPAIGNGGREGGGGHPEEPRMGPHQRAKERGDGVYGVERKIAQAPLQRWGDTSPPLCTCRRAASNASATV